MAEPDNLVLELLRAIRAEVVATRAELKADVADVRSEVHSLRSELRADINSLRSETKSDMLALRKELSEQIVGLRRSVVEDHSSVIGHGIPISELEARVRRLENHLHLDDVN